MKYQSVRDPDVHFCLHNKKDDFSLEEKTLLCLNFETAANASPALQEKIQEEIENKTDSPEILQMENPPTLLSPILKVS